MFGGPSHKSHKSTCDSPPVGPILATLLSKISFVIISEIQDKWDAQTSHQKIHECSARSKRGSEERADSSLQYSSQPHQRATKAIRRSSPCTPTEKQRYLDFTIISFTLSVSLFLFAVICYDLLFLIDNKDPMKA